MGNNDATVETRARQARRYLLRALRCRCPVCGISPMFLPVSRVESITDWVDTLTGCPRCDYAYHREPGYFLLPLWIFNFWAVALVGVVEVLALDYLFQLPTPLLMFITLVSMWVIGLLSVRHTKALFLAVDHFVHPHTEKPEPWQRPEWPG